MDKTLNAMEMILELGSTYYFGATSVTLTCKDVA